MTLVKYKSAPVSTASPVDRLASEILGESISRLFRSDGFMDHGPRVNIIERNDDLRLEKQAPGFTRVVHAFTVVPIATEPLKDLPVQRVITIPEPMG
ncbi:MAG: hypothetical protein IPN85_04755 [Flavobacteriales bacterium]|nr:hypothetical protein [Flavobacteriales bacterium]